MLGKPCEFEVRLACRLLLIFAGATVLFQFSNAAILSLVDRTTLRTSNKPVPRVV